MTANTTPIPWDILPGSDLAYTARDEDTNPDRPAARTVASLRSCKPRPMTDNTPSDDARDDCPINWTMPDIATDIVIHLRAHGFSAYRAVERQLLALAEETGEAVGAYRRWSGQARRTGTLTDLAAELADVVITAYVAAHEMGVDLHTEVCYQRWVYPTDLGLAEVDVDDQVLALVTRTAQFIQTYTSINARPHLARVVTAVCTVADSVGINLMAAINTKLDVIFTRGWRDGGEPQ